jgi:hypothetical protein
VRILKLLSKDEILGWNLKYDKDHPWWVQKENELGSKFRTTRTLTKRDLLELVDWKFKELVGRKTRVSGLVSRNRDEMVQKTCSQVFSMTPRNDALRIDSLDRLEGIGPALASVILTFYDPNNYGVHDIHVWREFFGPEPPTIFIGNGCYLKLLAELRKEANKYSLSARMVEKAYFKKNFEESK